MSLPGSSFIHLTNIYWAPKKYQALSLVLVTEQWTKHTTLKTVWRFLKKLKIELPYDSAILLLGIYLKKPKTLIWKDTSVFITLFTIAKTWKQPKCPSTDEWIKKVWYIYNGVLLSHKKAWNFAICSNMDGLGGHYAKWNKSERER